MRQWTTGVCVVTSKFEGVSHGMTANTFTSVSLTPPQALVSLMQDTRTHAVVKDSKIFAVSVLGEGQQAISDRFAGRVPNVDKFEGVETFSKISGAPLIAGAIAHFDCRVIATFTSGTHSLFIGQVLFAQSNPQGKPLAYYDRDYHEIVMK
jgi:flavin reductase (DIM6/NTAB) family NADH-FMN oxidoreductase RutF